MKRSLIDSEKAKRIRIQLQTGTVCYSVLTILCFGLMFASFLVTNGESIRNVFFKDTLDTGMDFFNSMAETAGGTPYTAYGTLYPPLANLFFYILQRCVPYTISDKWADTHSGIVHMRGTALDLRVRQAPMLMFIFYMLFTISLLTVVVEAAMGRETKFSKAFSVACCFGYGSIYALERGNIILLSVVFAFIFAFFRNSESRLVREFALISLAISAGLKIYPAILGIVLLKDRQWKRAVRTIIYGILAFVLPFFVFEGTSAMKVFFGVLFRFSESGKASVGGFGLSGMFNYGYEIFNNITGSSIPFQSLVTVLLKDAVLFGLLFVICSTSTQWIELLSLTLILVFVQKSGNYTTTFFLIPFVAFLKENPQINRKNAFPYLFFFAVLLPYITPKIYLNHSLHEAIVMVFLLGITAYIVVREVRVNRSQIRQNHLHS